MKTIQMLLVGASVAVLAACGSDGAAGPSSTAPVAETSPAAQGSQTAPSLPTTPITDAPEITTAPGGDQVPATTPARGATPARDKVNRKDAMAVAEAFITTRESWDARTDSSPQEAIERATAYTNPTFANNLRMKVGEPSGDYAALEEKDGYTTVAVTNPKLDGGTDATKYTADREVTAHYKDGTTKSVAKGTVTVDLTKDDTGAWWVIGAK